LRATIRSDVDRKRLCLTGFIKGLFILAHLTPEPVPPFVADLIPGTVHTEDFDEESGSVDIHPVIKMSRLILSNVLATSGSLVVDGKVGFNMLIDVIRNEGHSVKTAMNTNLERMVGEKYRILRKRTGNVETDHALIVKNSSNDNICLVFSLFQIASTNHYTGIHCLASCHE
jgi:hypothetical protein